MGKKEGKKPPDTVCVVGMGEVGTTGADVAGSVDVGVVAMSGVGVAGPSEGFCLIGRSMWSDGVGGRSVFGGPGSIFVVVTGAVAVSWLSSLCSGRGCSFWMEASMHSPHRFSLQSRNLPSNGFTLVSLTIIVQVPIPDSPLI